MIERLAPVALLGLALASGCSRPPTTTSAPAPSTVSSSREQGDVLARGGDHAGAVAKYREALQATPDDVGLRFALGSALTQLDRRDEAIEHFRWVIEHGQPGQQEVAMARQWLASASEQESSSSRRDVTMSSGPGAEGQPGSPGVGSIKGKTAWPSVNPDSQPVALELRFNGDDEATTGKNYRLHIGLGRPYSMSDLPAGAYRVVGRSGGIKLWEQRVVVGAGKETALDLSEANSAVTPKDFPPSSGGQ